MPEYRGLELGASLLMAVALVLYDVAALSAVIAVMGAMSGGAGGTMAIMMMVGPAASAFVSGALLHKISSAATALRVIARNSFR